MAGNKFQSQEQKTSPCLGGLYRCGFLFSARNSLRLRVYLVQLYHPEELIFEEMAEQRILCSQKWKKTIDSISFFCQLVKSVVAETWIYSLCCPHQLDNSNIFENSFLCSHTI